MQVEISQLLRSHLKDLKPYSSARDEYTGTASIFLDANENPYSSVGGGDYTRYPDPYQKAVKKKIADIKGVDISSVFLGNGSDEPIDLLIRVFCEPKQDHIIILPPTYGMYQVAADISGVEVKAVPLTEDFQIDEDSLWDTITSDSKILFICSPNNPTGNLIDPKVIESIIFRFDGLVVLDEAYIDFSDQQSFMSIIKDHNNVVILQTLSKAWGLAGVRFGMAFADAEIIQILNKVKYPYNINSLTQQKVLNALDHVADKEKVVNKILDERTKLMEKLSTLPNVVYIYPTQANFVLVKMKDASLAYNHLMKDSIIVRDRSKVMQCEECLRLTVGTKEENENLISSLKKLSDLSEL